MFTLPHSGRVKSTSGQCSDMDIFVIFLFILFASASSLRTKRYRSDYVYNRKTDAFYKLHIESVWNLKAISTCETESANVMVPSSQLDIAQAHGMFKQFPDIGGYLWVGDDTLKHEPVEERAVVDLDLVESQGAGTLPATDELCEVITRAGEVEMSPCYMNRPFICKVHAKDAPYDSHCQVFGRGYNYVASVGSCYKISQMSFSWNQAYSECRAEGAHLVVINSVLEKEIIINITKESPLPRGTSTPWFYYVGARAEKKVAGVPRVFKTIFGQTLQEAGFDEWSANEPNNFKNREDCVSIYKSEGKYNDLTCSSENAFICEREVNLTLKR